MKTVFFGSDEFAIEPLELLHGSIHEVVLVVGRPDRPAGRGLAPSRTPLVKRALELGLEVLQPESLTEAELRETLGAGWEAGVVVAYGGLIPGWLLQMPPAGFVNLHPSLLPRYRGAAPVERALMNGASITGVTTIIMDERLDSGDILMHREVPINDDDTAGTLGNRLSHLGAQVLLETLDGIESGKLVAVHQEEDKATYAPAVSQADALISWEDTAERIERKVRALNPTPGAFTYFRGKRLKIWEAKVTDVPPEDEPGTIMNMGKEGFLANTASNCIRVVTVQPEGRQRMSAGEYSRGQRLLVAERFTSGPQA